MDKINIDYQPIIESIRHLSGAHVWLLLAVLVFGVCAVLTLSVFRQFNRHRDILKDDIASGDPEAILIDTCHCTSTTRYTISKKPVMIGRVETNDSEVYDSVVVPDVTVGRQHAVIEYSEGVFWMQDQGSVNGSFINGQRIDGKHRLKDGDYIKIHKFTFQFVERFVFGHEQINEADAIAEMPKISPSFEPVLSMRPNDVLASQNDHIESVEEEPAQTGALYRKQMQSQLSKLEPNDQRRVSKKTEDMTVQLFTSSEDDKTQRLYPEADDGPPLDQPEIKTVAKSALSNLTLMPDMGEKVKEALGDFFDDTQDEDNGPTQLELTKKGDRMAQMGHFSALPPSARPLHEKSRKE